jgi:hypothetical protein
METAVFHVQVDKFGIKIPTNVHVQVDQTGMDTFASLAH